MPDTCLRTRPLRIRPFSQPELLEYKRKGGPRGRGSRTVYKEAQGRETNTAGRSKDHGTYAGDEIKVGRQEVPLGDTENTFHREGSA